MTYGSDGLDIKDLALRVGAGRLSLSGHSGIDAGPQGERSERAAGGGSICSRLASVCPASPTARRRSAERRAIRPASGGCVCSAWSRRKCATPACPRLTSRAPAGSAGGRTSIDATINAGTGNTVRVTGSAPLAPDGRARREDRRRPRRSPRQFHAFRLRPSRRGLARGCASAARDDRKAAGARNGSLERRRTPDDQTGFKLTGVTGTFVANGEHDPDRSSSQGQRRTPVRSAPPAK